jgi:D-3-phosphoglycerate dehydrogenase
MFTVFQIDGDKSLEPLDYERLTIARAGGELVVGNCTSEEELIEKAQGASVLWLAWKPGITRNILESLPKVELVVRWGVGFDQIDVAAATELGVAVANAPAYGAIDVAEHVIALLMSGARRVAWYHEQMRRGHWPAAIAGTTHRIAGRTIGIIGVGRIGANVARLASGLGMNVTGYDPALSAEQLTARGVHQVSLDELLETSDFISLHLPLMAETEHFFDAAKIEKMKRGSALLNASRGRIVDTAALRTALASGQLAWAALDVFEQEPLPEHDPLRQDPNVVLTPHVASFSDEAWVDLREEMCRTTTEWVRDGWTSSIVNPAVRTRLRRSATTANPL